MKPVSPESQNVADKQSSSSLSQLLVKEFGEHILAYQKYLAHDGKILSLPTILANHIDHFRKRLASKNKEDIVSSVLQEQGKEQLARSDVKDMEIHGLKLIDRSDRMLVDLIDTSTQQALYTHQIAQLDRQLAQHRGVSGGSKAFMQYLGEKGLPTKPTQFGTGEKQLPRQESYFTDLVRYVRLYIDEHTSTHEDAQQVVHDIYASNTFSLASFEAWCKQTTGIQLTHDRKQWVVSGGKKYGADGLVHKQGIKKQQKQLQNDMLSVLFSDEQGAKDNDLAGLVTLAVEQDVLQQYDINRTFEQAIDDHIRWTGLHTMIADQHTKEHFLQADKKRLGAWESLVYETIDDGTTIRKVPKKTFTENEQKQLRKIASDYVAWLAQQDTRYASMIQAAQYLSDAEHEKGDDAERLRYEQELVHTYVKHQLQKSKKVFYEQYLPYYAGIAEEKITTTQQEILRKQYESFMRDIYDPAKKIVVFPHSDEHMSGGKIVFERKSLVINTKAGVDGEQELDLDDLVSFSYHINTAMSDPVLLALLSPAYSPLRGVHISQLATGETVDQVLAEQPRHQELNLEPWRKYRVTHADTTTEGYPRAHTDTDDSGEKHLVISWYPAYTSSEEDTPLLVVDATDVAGMSIVPLEETQPLVTNMSSDDIAAVHMAYFASLGKTKDTPSYELDETLFSEGEQVSDTERQAYFPQDIQLARSSAIPAALFLQEQELSPDKVQSADDIHAWIDGGALFINQDYLEGHFGVTISVDDDGHYRIDNELASSHQQWRDIAREVVRLKQHEIAHRYFTFHDIVDTGDGAIQIATETPEGQQHVFSQEELCRLAEGAWTYTDPRTAERWVSFLTDTGEEVIISLSAIEEHISNITGQSFSFRALKQLELQTRQAYQQHPEKFASLLAARSAAEYEDASRAQRQVIDASSFATAEQLAEHIKTISNDAARYPSATDAVSYSPEFSLADNLYRWKLLEGNTDPLLVRLDEQADGTVLEQPVDPGRVAQHALPTPPPVGGRDDAADSTEDVTESPTDALLHVFNNKFKGDARIVVENLSQLNQQLLFFRGPVSQLPGHGNIWLRGRIHYTGGDTYELEIIDSTEGSGSIQKRFTQPMTKEGLETLLGRFAGEVYKVKDTRSMRDMYQDLFGSGVLDGTHTANWSSFVINNAGEKTAEVDQKKVTEPIQYVGRENAAGKHDFYKIQDKGSRVHVELTGHSTYSFSKDMDWTSFFVFLQDKGLTPYTQSEYKAIKAEPGELKESNRNRRDSFMSLGSIIAAFKKFPEAYKYKFEQQQKFESAKLYASLAGKLPALGFLYLEDIQADAESELDSSIWQIINQHKERLGRNDGDKSSVHKKMAALRIDQEIFQRMGTSEKFRLKAAGYLLYALDQGTMYFRELSHHADKGLWVKALMGERHQKVFLEKRRLRYEKLKNLGWEEEEAMADLMNFEIMYIADTTSSDEWRSLYGSKFGKSVESYTESENNDLEAAKKGINSKSSFYEVFQAVEGGIGKLEPGKMVAGLESMLERMEYPHHYDLTNRIIIQMYASGVLTHAVRAGMKGKLKQLGRTYGMPLLLMAKDLKATQRVTYMLDALAMTAGIQPSLSGYIDKKGWSGYDAAKITYDNFAEYKESDLDGKKENYKHAKHVKTSAAAGKWRDMYGKVMIDAINGKNTYYREAMTNNALSSDHQDALQYFYQKKMHDGETNIESGLNKNAFRSENAPNFEEGIMNLSPATFKGIMWSTRGAGGRLVDATAQKMWSLFTNKIQHMSANIDAARASGNTDAEAVMLHYMVKKFLAYFGNSGKVSGTDMDKIVTALKHGGGTISSRKWNRSTKTWEPDTLTLSKFISEKFLMNEGKMTDEDVMQEGVEAYIKFFETNQDRIATLMNTPGTLLAENL